MGSAQERFRPVKSPVLGFSGPLSVCPAASFQSAAVRAGAGTRGAACPRSGLPATRRGGWDGFAAGPWLSSPLVFTFGPEALAPWPPEQEHRVASTESDDVTCFVLIESRVIWRSLFRVLIWHWRRRRRVLGCPRCVRAAWSETSRGGRACRVQGKDG